MAEIGTGLIRVDANWLTVKSFVASKKLSLQYDESNTAYEIFAIDGSIVYYCIIYKGTVPVDTVTQVDNDSYKADFLANYKDIVTNRVIQSSVAYDGYLASTSNPLLVAGSDGSFIRTLKASSDGYLLISGQGTAGTALGGIVSVQGVAGGTPQPMSQSGTWTVQPGNTANTTPWLTTIAQGGNSATVSAGGALKVDGSAVTQPVSGTVSITANSSVNLSQIAGTTTATGNGVAGAGVQRVAIVSDNTAFSVNSVQSGTWSVRNLDGAGNSLASSTTTPGGTEQALIVRNIPSGTQAVSGTVTANIGTSGSLALDATLAKLTVAQGAATGTNTQALVGAVATSAAPTYTTATINPFSLTTAGALRVDGSASTQPVSGTVSITANSSVNLNQIAGTTTATGNGVAGAGVQRVTIASDNTAFSVNSVQSGTWTVQPGNTANTTAWLVTSAADGTVSPGTAATKSNLGGAVYNSTLPTATTGQQVALQADANGQLRIASLPTGSNVIGAVTQSGSWSTSVTQATASNLNATVVGSGTAGTPAGGVLSIQGVSGGTALSVTPTNSATIGSAVPSVATYMAGSDGVLARAPMLFDTGLNFATPSGTHWTLGVNLRKAVSGGSVELGTSSNPIRVDVTGSTTQPVSGTVSIGANSSVNVTQLNGNTIALGNGGTTGGTLRVTVVDDTPVPVTGTVTATNNSVGLDAAAAPGSSTQIGGPDSTGNLQAINVSNADLIGTEQGIVSRSLTYVSQSSGFFPDPSADTVGVTPIFADITGRLETRATVLSDEFSFREDFNGTNFYTTLTGTVSFTNGSAVVTGSGTAFLSELKAGDLIKRSTHAESALQFIDTVVSDTQVNLAAAYTGATSSGTAQTAKWFVQTPSGGSLSQSSAGILVMGTASGSTGFFYRDVDYGPLGVNVFLTISQRIANQTTRCGFVDSTAATPNYGTYFEFTGTTNTSVNCVSRSSSAGADSTTTTVTLPNAATTAAQNKYRIEVTALRASFLINDVCVAIHELHIPGPYDVLDCIIYSTNTGTAASATTITTEAVSIFNFNRVQIAQDFVGEGAPTKLQVTTAPATANTAPVFLSGTTLQGVQQYNALHTRDAITLERMYYASSSFTMSGSITDVFTLTGSSTRTVRIQRFLLTGSQTTGSYVNFDFTRRSTANSGGTSTTLTAQVNDTNFAAATATPRVYSANPTLGTSVGTMEYKLYIPSTASPNQGIILDEVFQNPIVLRGASQVWALNFNNTAVTGASFSATIWWTED